MPPVLPGEDEESYVRHTKKMVEFAGKKSPPTDVVSTLMERSHAIRRKTVVENMPSVSQILEVCPFLGRISQV